MDRKSFTYKARLADPDSGSQWEETMTCYWSPEYYGVLGNAASAIAAMASVERRKRIIASGDAQLVTA